MSGSDSLTRRSFLRTTSACAAHLAFMAAPFPLAARTLWSERSRGLTVARESFGRLEEVGDGLFAFISTPLTGDYTTVSNGGIIAGRSGVLVVEAFQTPEGARWMAEKARDLTGRWPTHVLVTHYHGDHSRGVDGYLDGDGGGEAGATLPEAPQGPRILATPVTREWTAQRLPSDAAPILKRLWADVVLVDGEEPSSLDLGDRQVRLVPRQGHTASDVTVELPDEEMIWCGDLLWNGMFPNYMDAVPSRLSRSVRALQARDPDLFVPGHGPLANRQDMARYLDVIDGIEQTARTAVKEGWTSEEAGNRHRIPESLGEWTLFNPTYFQRAVEAWMKEWDQGG